MLHENALHRAALAYAEKGYPVFPIEPKGKAPLGQLVPNGVSNASNSFERVNYWWEKASQANIGLAVEASNFIVIDLDRHPGKADGLETFEKLRGSNPFPETVCAETGGNGLHLIFKRPKGLQFKSSLGPGVDVKHNGYIVVPPSVHNSGKAYQWKEGSSLLDREPSNCPDWLLKKLIKPKRSNPKQHSSDFPPSSAHLIKERCPFIKRFAEQPSALSEPEWYEGIGVLAYTEEASTVIHEWSAPYPGYGSEETAQKVEHRLADGFGPARCQTIQSKCAVDLCNTCPHKGKISSPIVLGRISRHREEPHLEAFPVNSLPPVLKNFALAVSESIQCPVDYLGSAMLAVLSVLIGKGVKVRLEPEWTQAANLWVALVGEPASKKSPALTKALKPLQQIEERLHREYNEKMKHFKEQEAAFKESKQDGSGEGPPIPPVRKRLTTSDSTVEAIADLLASNPSGIGMFTDELASWIQGMCQYKGGKGSDRAQFLSMWNNAPLTVDRKNKEPLIVPESFLSVLGTIQPSVLGRISEGNGEDGFKERLLYSHPKPLNQPPRVAQPVEPALHNDYKELCDRIYSGRSFLYEVSLSSDAQARYLEIKQEWYYRTKAPDFPQEMAAYYSKMESYLGRFALILHQVKRLTDGKTGTELEVSTMNEAFELAEYFLNHAEKAFGLLRQTQEERYILGILNWANRNGKLEVNARECQQAKIPGCHRASKTRFLLEAASDYGFGFWTGEVLFL